jgi:hypothetical protein
MPVVVVLVTDVPESRAQPQKPLPDAQSAPNRANLDHSSGCGAARSISSRSMPETARSSRSAVGPEHHPASDAQMKGEVRQKHTSPHITHSQQRNYLLRLLPVGCRTLAVSLPNTELTVT